MSQSHNDIPERAEITIVGAGVIGLSLAFELTARGRDVLVLDRGDLEGLATPAAAGMLAPVAESDIELTGLNAFRRFSHELYPEFVAAELYPEFVAALHQRSGIDCGFDQAGTLLVAVDRDHREELERLQTIFSDQGFPVQWLTGREVLQREASLTPRVVCGLSLEQDHCLDTRLLLQALRKAVEGKGGRIVSGVRVQDIAADGTVQAQRLHDGQVVTVQSEAVVLAAGSWSNVELHGVLAHLPIRPVKGQVIRLKAASLLQRVVRTPDIYLIPQHSGDLVLGATVEEQGFDVVPTAGGIFDLLRHAWRVLPGIYDMPLQEISVGFRPTTRDHLPVIGRLGATRVLAATGHYRNGILQAPGTARLLADLICEDKQHELLGAFSPDRFDVSKSVRASDGAPV